MPAAGPHLHFAASFLAVVLVAAAANRRRLGAYRASLAAFASILTLGQLKEVFDLARNPWSLSPAELRLDSALDMGWNLAGALCGAAAWAAIAGALGWLGRQAAGRIGTSPALPVRPAAL